jgi:DNA polymerase I
VLAEAEAPGAGGEVPAAAVNTAVAVMDCVLDGWRAIPGGDQLSYSRKDDALFAAVEKLATWIEQKGGCTTRRQIQLSQPAGIRNAGQLADVLRAYEGVYPGSVRVETPEDRAEKERSDGPYGTLVFAPRRSNGKSPKTEKHSSTGLLGANSPSNSHFPVPENSAPGHSDPGPTVGSQNPPNSPAPNSPETVSPAESDAPASVLEPFQPGEITVVRSFTDLEEALPKVLAAPAAGLDIETTGLDPLKSGVRLVQLATGDHTYVLDCRALPSWHLAVQQVVNRCPALIIHNGAFDLRHLARAGVTMPAGLGDRVRDTCLAAMLLSAAATRPPRGYHSLGQVVERYLNAGPDKDLQTSDWSGELSGAQIEYAATDAAVLLPLRDVMTKEIASARLGRVAAIENRCLPALVWMMESGAPFDLDAHAKAAAETRQEAEELHAILDQQVAEYGAGEDINYRSPKQLTEMFARLGIKLTSTAEDTLVKVDHPLARLLLRYRGATKLQSTYGTTLAQTVAPDGRIHAAFKQCGSVAGRMSCTGPNLQQIPKAHGFRSLFRAPEGRKLVKADYSQIELRVAAEISGDDELIAAFAANADLHEITAQRVLGKDTVTKQDRQAAKAVNFGLLYGMGAEGLRKYAGNNYGVVMTPDEAAEYKERFFGTYHGLRSWHRKQPGYPMPVDTRTLSGRRRTGVRSFTEKLNTPVQGSGADGLKIALALLHERRDQAPAGTFPVLCVHDEIVAECSAESAEDARQWLVSSMTDGMGQILHKVPVVVDATVADTWEG